MRESSWDLGLATAISGMLVVLVLAGVADVGPLFLISVVVVLLLPGYVFAAALFPGNQLDFPAIATISSGASLALGALAGLVLHVLPVSMTAISWVIALAIVTWVLVLIAVIRRIQSPELQAVHVPVGETLSWRHRGYAVAAVGISVLAVLLAQSVARDQASAEFTQLWLLPDEQAQRIEVGVSNQHNERMEYQLVVFLDNAPYRDFSITIDGDEDWAMTFGLPDRSANMLEAKLYLDGEEQLTHREAFLTLDHGTVPMASPVVSGQQE